MLEELEAVGKLIVSVMFMLHPGGGDAAAMPTKAVAASVKELRIAMDCVITIDSRRTSCD